MPGTPLNPANWAAPYEVTIDNTKVGGSSNLSNFPVLIKDSNIPSAAYAQMLSSGADIRFTTDLAGTTEIPFEIVTITPGSQLAEIWVKVPTVSYNTDTVFYMWVGNASAVAYDANETYGSQAVWSDYVAVYHLQANGNDSAATGRNLVNGSAGSFPAVKIKNGADFNGSSQYLQTNDSNLSGFYGMSALTYQAWINRDNTARADVYLQAGSRSTIAEQAYILRNESTGNNNLSSRIRTASAEGAVTTAGTIVSGTPTLVHTTWDNSTVRVYLQGAVDANTATLSGGVVQTPGTSHDRFIIGAQQNTSETGISSHFDGKMDEVRIRASALSAGWIEAEYNNQNDPSTFIAIELAVEPATVTTETPATNITSISAEGGGNVTDDGGGTISERGIAWGTSPNPTIAGDHQASGSGTGAFTDVQMTGLDPDTHYYYRAYATNEAGTAYGADVEFDTLDAVISGTCTLNGNPVEGAIITLINSDTDTVVATDTTDASGNYAFLNLDVTVTYHVVAEYMDGYDMYNARSLPFMTPEEV